MPNKNHDANVTLQPVLRLVVCGSLAIASFLISTASVGGTFNGNGQGYGLVD